MTSVSESPVVPNGPQSLLERSKYLLSTQPKLYILKLDDYVILVAYKKELDLLLEQIRQLRIPSEINRLQVIDEQINDLNSDMQTRSGYTEAYSESGYPSVSYLAAYTIKHREYREEQVSLVSTFNPEMKVLLELLEKKKLIDNILVTINKNLNRIEEKKKDPGYLRDIAALHALREKLIHDDTHDFGKSGDFPTDEEFLFLSLADPEAFYHIIDKYMTSDLIFVEPSKDIHWSKCKSCDFKMNWHKQQFFCDLHN